MSCFKLIKSKSTHVASLHFLPPGQYGLCFGFFFSGPLPLRSHYNSPPLGVCFRESLVLIDYTQKLTRSTLSLKLSVAQPVYLWVTACDIPCGNFVVEKKIGPLEAQFFFQQQSFHRRCHRQSPIGKQAVPH